MKTKPLKITVPSLKSIFGLSLQAYRAENNTVEHSAWVVMARSTEDAEMQGLKQALKLWPVKRGWARHGVSSIELNLIQSSQQSADEENEDDTAAEDDSAVM